MKKLLFTLVLTLTTVGVFDKAHAATLFLQGQVAANCTLDSVDTAAYGSANTSLPIVAGTTSTSVANATVTCNNQAGYQITATSANGLSRLQHTTDPTSYSSYQLGIVGAGTFGFQTLSSTPTVLKSTALPVPITGEVSAINIRIDPNTTGALAGTYEDTVTITLTAN